jgi:hypothetical protein
MLWLTIDGSVVDDRTSPRHHGAVTRDQFKSARMRAINQGGQTHMSNLVNRKKAWLPTSKQASISTHAPTPVPHSHFDAGLHVGVKDMRPLLIRQIGQALDLLLSSVVVEQDVNLAFKVRLGLVGELFHLGELAQVASDELELGRGRVLVDVLGQVFDVLDFLFVVVEQKVGSLVGAERRGRFAKQIDSARFNRVSVKGSHPRKDGK